MSTPIVEPILYFKDDKFSIATWTMGNREVASWLFWSDMVSKGERLDLDIILMGLSSSPPKSSSVTWIQIYEHMLKIENGK